MKKLAIFILAFAITVNADEEITVDIWADRFETDTSTVQECLEDAKTSVVELMEVKNKFKDIQDEDEVDEETKKIFVKHNSFIACMLEKKDLMEDSKLVLDKILEIAENDKDLPNSPTKEALTECVTSLNENSEMSREDRAFGLSVCFFSSDEDIW